MTQATITVVLEPGAGLPEAQSLMAAIRLLRGVSEVHAQPCFVRALTQRREPVASTALEQWDAELEL